jgi:hypothetical protein
MEALAHDGSGARQQLPDGIGVEHSAAGLEQFTQLEPLPFADFYVVRGRALAAFGRGRGDIEELAAALKCIRDEGERLGIRIALPSIETAPLGVGLVLDWAGNADGWGLAFGHLALITLTGPFVLCRLGARSAMLTVAPSSA